MQVTINLTPVLVALIICVFLYAMCKMARKDEAKKTQKDFVELKVPEFVNGKNNMQVVSREEHAKIHRIPSTQEQDLREYVEGRIQEGESGQ